MNKFFLVIEKIFQKILQRPVCNIVWITGLYSQGDKTVLTDLGHVNIEIIMYMRA